MANPIMSQRIFHIATRKSPLALWQAEYVRKALYKINPDLKIELLPLITSGDTFLKDKLLKVGGKGLFVKELEIALLEKKADLAVHSMKDVPANFPEGLLLPVICKRDNPLDAFVSPHYPDFASLPKGARLGTSSLRRQSQLLALRPDLVIQNLRGNIHSRLKKMQDGEFDGIILAAAGLERMDLTSCIQEIFSTKDMLPACGQGALGIECREDDEEVLTLLASLNDPLSSLCVHAERSVNAILGGNCHVPLAVYCSPLQNEHCQIEAKVLNPDGRFIIHALETGLQKHAMDLAKRCADQLIHQGAFKLLENLNA